METRAYEEASFAGIAQLVERDLAKVEATSSNLVTRSKPKSNQSLTIYRLENFWSNLSHLRRLRSYFGPFPGLLPRLITREVKESFVVDEVEVGQFKNPKDYPEIEELCAAKT